VRATIAAAKTPVEWVVVDASSINVIDITALQKLDELREELAAQGIVLATARVKQSLLRFFNYDWGMKRHELHAEYRFHTVKSAVRAFKNRIDERRSPGPDSSSI
jgi:SulP family sulfate permease